MIKYQLTKRGIEWEHRHSWYRALPVFFMGGPTFIYLGTKVKKRAWVIEGLFYLLLFPLMSSASFSTVAVGLWIASIIRGFVVRDEYIIRLDVVQDMIGEQMRIDSSRLYNLDVKSQKAIARTGNPVIQPNKPVSGPVNQQKANPDKPKDNVKLYEHIKMMELDDYFKTLDERYGHNVFFYRITGYNREVGSFVERYYDRAMQRGLVITDSLKELPNIETSPYYEWIDHTMALNEEFFHQDLNDFNENTKSLPKDKIGILAKSIYATMMLIRKTASSWEDMKISYAMFLYWLDKVFAPILPELGNAELPKIFIDGKITYKALMMLNIISDAGADAVILAEDRGASYRMIDPVSQISNECMIAGLSDFPENFSLASVASSHEMGFDTVSDGLGRRYEPATNVAATGDIFMDIRKPEDKRGGRKGFYYNIFARVIGGTNPTDYNVALYNTYSALKKQGRGVAIVEGEIPVPDSNEEAMISDIVFDDYDKAVDQLSGKLQYGFDVSFQWFLINRFKQFVKQEAPNFKSVSELAENAGNSIIYMKRYMRDLFTDKGFERFGFFVHLGPCVRPDEIFFVRFLATLPVDVLILVPNTQSTCMLYDQKLFEKKFPYDIDIKTFPTDPSKYGQETVAYKAEKELEDVLYTGTGLYRDYQYEKAEVIPFKTMFEEIELFWGEDIVHRPGFVIENRVVRIPAFFAKISGVKDGNTDEYWNYVHARLTKKTVSISHIPFSMAKLHANMDAYVGNFLEDGVLKRDVIISHPAFRYGNYRKNVIDHILDCLQLMLDRRIIKGTFENGAEYTVVSTVLSIDNYFVRMIQDFDFVKVSPKIIYIYAEDKAATVEDAILLSFFNLVGFDCLIMAPSGNVSVEGFYNDKIVTEYNIGPYSYDITVPDLAKYVPKKTNGFFKLFK